MFLKTLKEGERQLIDMLAYCGLTCQGCPIHWATLEKDEEKQYKMRVEIARICQERYGVEYKPEDITDCDGCRTEDGRLFSGCKNCEIRKCTRQRGLENCAHCSEYACGRLEEFFVTDPSAKTRLDIIRASL